jgi:exopolyphosphatase/guanosine-5'-triphosphate,3'-diphosphate pyrophosphatase
MDRDLRPQVGPVAMKIAGIDVGTNTVLLLVADVDPRGAITILAEGHESPRLGRNVDRSGSIARAGFEGLASALDRYVAIARSHGAEAIRACATSAVRDASNGGELLGFIERRCGIRIEVIDGPTEALLTYRGALTGPSASVRDPVVIDIGGGSTEFCHAPPGAVNGGRVLTAVSLDIGSVRLAERYFRHSPPLPAEVDAARGRIAEDLAQVVNPGFGFYTPVAVSGTATTLAGLHLGLDRFDNDRIDGCAMSAATVHAMAAGLLVMDAPSVRALSGLTEGREDILAAGALILSAIAGHFGFREVRVSTRGLRYGIVLGEWERISGTGRPGG